MHHHETHNIHRSSGLRAAVLGANDGIISTASLVIGVAAAGANTAHILLVGVAGLVAGAMSMAAGEYVSVSSQADIERADLVTEEAAIDQYFEEEKEELAHIYQNRGVTKELSYKVAEQLMAHDALGAHARDELGISDHVSARPIQAAAYSAIAFTIGAALPLLAVFLTTYFALQAQLIILLGLSSLFSLAILGAIAAYVGGAPIIKAILRVTLWGAFAMIVTAIIGELFDVAI
jgi:VIT1/CCC1 family predicted Fe2+/Mn2+ transporter